MSDKVKAILSAAMELTDAERVDLADLLFCSVSPEYQAEVDQSWAEEIDRRVKEIDDGTAELVPWEQVRDRLLKRAGQ
jgi:putative addiction module component (TIGR02574 family)